MAKKAEKNLVIVESPAKAKTIGKYLGPSYQVKACMGHLRDLPKSKLGVDVDNDFEPDYRPIKGKEDIIRDLRAAADESAAVYLATDPDREGEAISWHLKYLLELPDERAHRVTFNEITRKVVEYAHDHGVVVEAELGTLAGIEDDVKVADHAASYTRPEEVEEFVSKTGCDSLAIAIGTSHGAYKFKPEQCTVNEKGILVPPPLRFDVLEEVSKRLPGFPIVLHGSSSVPQEYVKMINEHGGKMPNAIGVPEEQLRQAARLSVCKINIDSDLRLAMTGTIRQFMDEHPDKFDPREYLKPARANIKELVRHKLVDVLGCAGKA